MEELIEKLKALKAQYYEAVDEYGVRSTEAKAIKQEAEPLMKKLSNEYNYVIIF